MSLTPREQKDMAATFTSLTNELLAHRNQLSAATIRRAKAALASGSGSTGVAAPDWHVGLGWYVYLHHLTPNDQRWFMGVGTTFVATVVCAASDFDPAACAWGAFAAYVIVDTIEHYFDPPY